MDLKQLVDIGLVKEADVKKVGDYMRESGRRDFLKQAVELLRASNDPSAAIAKLASMQEQQSKKQEAVSQIASIMNGQVKTAADQTFQIPPELLMKAIIKVAQENPGIVPDEVLAPMVEAAAEAEGVGEGAGEGADTEITVEDVAEGITQLAQELGIDEEAAAQALLGAMAKEEADGGSGSVTEQDVESAIQALPEEEKNAMLRTLILG